MSISPIFMPDSDFFTPLRAYMCVYLREKKKPQDISGHFLLCDDFLFFPLFFKVINFLVYTNSFDYSINGSGKSVNTLGITSQFPLGKNHPFYQSKSLLGLPGSSGITLREEPTLRKANSRETPILLSS